MSMSFSDPSQNAKSTVAPKVLAIASGKGGVGKTTIAVNLATAIACTGQRTLLLDGDFSLANVDVALGLNPSRNLSHVLEGKCSIEEVIVHTSSGLMVVPASSGKTQMTDFGAHQNASIVRAFSEMTLPVDMMIVDTGAGISQSVLTLAVASQEVLVVVTKDPASITDAYALVKILSQECGVHRVQVVVNQTATLSEGREVFTSLQKVAERFLDVTLHLAGVVPHCECLKTSVRRQRPVVDLFPSSASAQALTALSKRVVRWEPSPPRGHLEFFVERLVQPVGVHS